MEERTLIEQMRRLRIAYDAEDLHGRERKREDEGGLPQADAASDRVPERAKARHERRHQLGHDEPAHDRVEPDHSDAHLGDVDGCRAKARQGYPVECDECGAREERDDDRSHR